MDTKEIKIGEKYKLELLCIYNTGKVITFETPTGDHLPFRERDLECVSPAAPKYDSCREFREGDKVRMVMRNGRHPYSMQTREHIVPSDTICTVVRCELNGFVAVEYNNGYKPVVHFSFLELVTPVEELEPYHLNEIYDIDDGKLIGYEVARGDTRDAIFYGGENHLRTIEQAKERAEAERDRLNAEYRKEQNNG